MKKLLFIATIITSGSAFAVLEVPQAQVSMTAGKLVLTSKVLNRNHNLFFSMNGKALGAPAQFQEKRGVILLKYQKKQWDLDIKITPCKELFSADFTLKVHKQELKLEPGVNIGNLSGMKKCWRGFNRISDIGQKKITRKGIKGIPYGEIANYVLFPVCAVYDDMGGVWAGNVYQDPVSWSGSEFDPVNSVLNYSIRVVAHPSTPLKFRLVFGAADAQYGLRENVVRQHYSSFPEVWHTDKNNPYIRGLHGTYLTWWGKPDFEKARRMFVTLDWSYCPYKRSGDITANDKLWNYSHPRAPKNTCGMGGIFWNVGKMSASQFRKLRKERFTRYGRRSGWMFYNSLAGTFTEIGLAEKLYPDSIINDPDSAPVRRNGWSTGHDAEIRTFPYHTSLAKQFEKDMEYIARELDPAGFAFDCASSGVYYRGPAVKKNIPGRAWDEKGIFIDQGVAINHQTAKVRELARKLKRPLTVFSNGSCQSDYVMFETPFVKTGTYNNFFPVYRWQIGQRPACSHGHGYCIPDIAPDWDAMSREEFITLLSKLADFVLLTQFRLGMTPETLNIYGTSQVLYIQPEALELMRLGWWPDFPARFKGEAAPYFSRYGTGAQSVFYLGNPKAHNITGTLSIDNRALLAGNALSLVAVRKMRDQAVTVNHINKGFTGINYNIEGRAPGLYEGVALIEDPGDLNLKVACRKDLHQISISITPQNKVSDPRKIQWKKFEDYYLHKGDKTLSAKAVALYKSKYFSFSYKQLADFGFTNSAGKVIFSVKAEPVFKNEANRFAEYFDFCRKNKIIAQHSPLPEISIGRIKNPPVARQVTLRTGQRTFAGINAGGGLELTAPDAASMNFLLEKLFRAMDKKYEYFFPFTSVMGLYDFMLNHHKLSKPLPVRRYFETEI